MVSYVSFLNLPTKIAIVIVGAFFVMQIIGEILEFHGKVVPEFLKVKKYFARRRNERRIIHELPDILDKLNGQIQELDRKLDKNDSDTLTMLIDIKRNTIIDFASMVIDENRPVTREQFNRIFRLHTNYKAIIESNGMTNGEVEIAFRIIQESYEKHLRNHTFVEDIRGY